MKQGTVSELMTEIKTLLNGTLDILLQCDKNVVKSWGMHYYTLFISGRFYVLPVIRKIWPKDCPAHPV